MEETSPALPTARELRERALQAQSELKKQLSSLSQESRELEGRLRATAGKKGGKRSRDERGDTRQEQQDHERSPKARRDSGGEDGQAAATSKAQEAAPEPAPGALAERCLAGALAESGDGKGAERRAARRAAQERTGGGVARRPEADQRPSPRTKEDADTRQRNRKMFGVLTAQLQRASEEHSERSGSAGSLATQQRKLVKVDERLRESSQKLREFEQSFVDGLKDADRRRQEQIHQQRAQLDERLLQLKWDAHEAELSQFLVTEVAGSRPIYYLPRKHSAATRAKLDEQQRARLQTLAGSAALKDGDPFGGLDLSTEPAPAAAPASAAAAPSSSASPVAEAADAGAAADMPDAADATDAPDAPDATDAADAADATSAADAADAAGSSDAPGAEVPAAEASAPAGDDSAAMDDGGAAPATAAAAAPEAPPAAAPAPAEPTAVQESPAEATKLVDDGGEGAMLDL